MSRRITISDRGGILRRSMDRFFGRYIDPFSGYRESGTVAVYGAGPNVQMAYDDAIYRVREKIGDTDADAIVIRERTITCLGVTYRCDILAKLYRIDVLDGFKKSETS